MAAKLLSLACILSLPLSLAAAEMTPGLDQRLFAAIDSNSMDQVSEAINNGADPNGADERGRSPLLVAHSKKSIDLFIHLLNSGADPNGRANARGDTILVALTGPGAFPYLEAFIRFGGELNAKINGPIGSEDYVFFLATSDRIDLFNLFISRGGKVSPSMKDPKGRSLLVAAIEAGQFRMACEILRKVSAPFTADLASEAVETLLNGGNEATTPRFRYWRNKLIDELAKQRRLPSGN